MRLCFWCIPVCGAVSLQALKWSDIDFAKQNCYGEQKSVDGLRPRPKDGVRIKHKKAKIKGTKTASGNRIVPLNTKAIAALNSLKAVYREMDIVSDSVCGNAQGYNTELATSFAVFCVAYWRMPVSTSRSHFTSFVTPLLHRHLTPVFRLP